MRVLEILLSTMKNEKYWMLRIKNALRVSGSINIRLNIRHRTFIKI